MLAMNHYFMYFFAEKRGFHSRTYDVLILMLAFVWPISFLFVYSRVSPGCLQQKVGIIIHYSAVCNVHN